VGILHLYNCDNGDIDSGVMAKFGVSQPLESWQNSFSFSWQKNWLCVPHPSSPLSLMGQSHPKFPERCHPLICACLPNLVHIGSVCWSYSRKIAFSAPEVITGFQATVIVFKEPLLVAPRFNKVRVWQWSTQDRDPCLTTSNTLSTLSAPMTTMFLFRVKADYHKTSTITCTFLTKTFM